MTQIDEKLARILHDYKWGALTLESAIKDLHKEILSILTEIRNEIPIDNEDEALNPLNHWIEKLKE